MDSRFENALENVSSPVYASNPVDVVEMYKDEYGAKGWTKKIVDDLVSMTGMKRGSVSRQFQMDARKGAERYKGEKMRGEWAERFKKLGEMMPPIGRKPNNDKIDFVITGSQYAGAGRPRRQRTIRVSLSGDRAAHWVDEPNWDDIWDEYDFDFGVDDEDHEYSLEGVSVSAS